MFLCCWCIYIRRDIVFGGDLLLGIHVHLGEGDLFWARQTGRQLLIERRNGLAWRTPICVDWFRELGGVDFGGGGGVGGAKTYSL